MTVAGCRVAGIGREISESEANNKWQLRKSEK